MTTRSETYLVMIRNEDGDLYVEVLDADELTARLNRQYWGSVHWLDSLPCSNPQEWPQARTGVIVRGGIITPKAVDCITRWSVT